jgi:hypothetical protein
MNPREPKCELLIMPDGQVRFLYDDALAPLLHVGQAALFRASHIEPIGSAWFADLSPVEGPTLGPFSLRADALHAEQEWLSAHYLPDCETLGRGDP